MRRRDAKRYFRKLSGVDLMFTLDEKFESKPDETTSLGACENDLINYEAGLGYANTDNKKLYIRGQISGMVRAIQNIHRIDKPIVEGPF